MRRAKALASNKKTDHELKTFLLDVVNAEDKMTDGASEYFFSRYPAFFPSKETDIKALLPFLGRRMTSPEGILLESRQVYYRAIIAEMRDWLRAIWNAEDEYTAEWRLFLLQSHLHQVTGIKSRSLLEPPPPEVPINQALRYLRRSLGRLKNCRNQDCRTPFFIADKGKQSYCSVDCAAVAQKEYKRRWWENSGQAWRESRRTREERQKPMDRQTRISPRKKPRG